MAFHGEIVVMPMLFLFMCFLSCCASDSDVEAEHERCCMILGICERGAMAMVGFIYMYIYVYTHTYIYM